MQVEDFIARLEGVKKTARGWMAKCSGHPDKSPSMTIALGDDGRILIKCWAGCDAWQIVGALGLELSDLFPEKLTQDHVPGLRRPFPASDALASLADEAMVLAIITLDIERGSWPKQEDIDRALLANQRIQAAVDYALGRR